MTTSRSAVVKVALKTAALWSVKQYLTAACCVVEWEYGSSWSRPVFELCDEPRTDLGLCFSPVFVCVSAGTGPITAHLCVPHTAPVYRRAPPGSLIQPSSPIHPLILLTYTLILSSSPFIHLSTYPVMRCLHPLTLCSPWVSPFSPASTSNHFSGPPSPSLRTQF